MKEFITRKKIYKIDERGIVYQEDGVTLTKDISIKNDYYCLGGKALHKIVYELYKGPIPKGMICHHRNICSRDNRPENLIILDKQEHDKIHRELNLNKQLKEKLKSEAIPFYYEQYRNVYKSPKSTYRKTGKTYYQKHKEERLQYSKKYREQNIEKWREQNLRASKKYYEKHKEEILRRKKEKRNNAI